MSALLLALVICASGCGSKDGEQDKLDAAAADRRVTVEAHEGAVSLLLTASAGEIDIQDNLTVRMEITAGQGVTVEPYAYDRALAEDENRFDYRVVRCDRVEAVPAGDGKLRWSYECEMEFLLPGEYELPGASIAFVDTGELGDGKEGRAARSGVAAPRELSTESLGVVVNAAAGGELSEEELARIRTLAPVDLPRDWGPWPWLGPLIAAACAALVVMYIRGRRARSAVPPAPLPADVWARREIAALVADDLPARGLIQEFHYRISDIIRGYVERRFHISAPEMTTEEFLAKAAGDGRFGERNTAELVTFLNACDMVKYARQEPGPDQADRLIHAAGVFVERTRAGLAPTPPASEASVEERAA